MIAIIGTVGLLAVATALFFLSKYLLRWAGEHRAVVHVCFATALMAVLPATLCRWVGNLPVAVLVVGTLAAVGAFFARRLTPLSPPAGVRAHWPAPWSIAIGVVLFVLVAWVSIGFNLWDEKAHIGLANVIARGIVPPVHPLYPTEPFQYHWASDSLYAQVHALTGLRADHAIDVVTLLNFVLLLATSAVAGSALGGRAGASFGLFLGVLGGATLQFLFFRGAGALDIHWSLIPERWTNVWHMPPPVISNFLQHPQGLAMPLSLALGMLYATGTSSRLASRRRSIFGACLLGLLALVNVAFFLVMGFALGVTALVRGIRRRDGTGFGVDVLLLLGALGIAFALGGFLEGGADQAKMIRFGTSFFPGTLPEIFLRHAVFLGLPLLLLPIALWRLKRPGGGLRLVLLVASVAAVIVPNIAIYTRSWDIVKFFGVVAFAANVLYADWLAALWSRGKGWMRRAAVVLLVLAVVVSPMVWLLRMSVLNGRAGVRLWRGWKLHDYPGAIAKVLGPHVEKYDRVFTTDLAIAHGTGFFTPGFHWRGVGTGFQLDRRRIERLHLHRRLASVHMRRADLDALGVRFLVLGITDMRTLSPQGRRALADPSRFRLLGEVTSKRGRWKIYRRLQVGPYPGPLARARTR